LGEFATAHGGKVHTRVPATAVASPGEIAVFV